jgi:hypothetical protein
MSHRRQLAHDEAWGRGPGTEPALVRMAKLARMIEMSNEELARPDWVFGQSAVRMRARLESDRKGFEETLAELQRGLT